VAGSAGPFFTDETPHEPRRRLPGATGPRTRALLRALDEHLRTAAQLADFERRHDGLGDRHPDADSVAADPGDVRDEASRLRASLQALAPRLAASRERLRVALRAASAVWDAGLEDRPAALARAAQEVI
jgi:hypothetical protein